MIPKKLDEISISDIQSLIDSEVSETKSLEYKQTLPERSDSGKKEFLADVSSFANGAGGDIIFGVKERRDPDGNSTGLPEEIVPIAGQSADDAKLWLEAVIRNGLRPRIRVLILEIPIQEENAEEYVLLLRILKSHAAPHMVTFKNTSKFFGRSSAGKYQFDVDELRSAFVANETQAERIKSFRDYRISQIMVDEAPVHMATPYRFVFHIIPVSSFLNNDRLDLSDEQSLRRLFPTPETGTSESRYNLDGFLSYYYMRKMEGCKDYCQLFYNGTVEAVITEDLLIREDDNPRKGQLSDIYTLANERAVLEFVEKYMSGLRELGVQGPIILSLAILGCRGAYLWIAPQLRHKQHPIDRDTIIFPDIMIEESTSDLEQTLKPIFDAIWNASGFSRSLQYE